MLLVIRLFLSLFLLYHSSIGSSHGAKPRSLIQGTKTAFVDVFTRSLATSVVAFSAVSKSDAISVGEDDKVVVIGANGRTGSELVKYCIYSGVSVRACTRSGEFGYAVDVTKPWTIPPAVSGASVVIFAATSPALGNPNAVDHKGLLSVGAACIEASVPRLVVISGAGVTKAKSPAYQFLNQFGHRMDEKLAGEADIRSLYESTAPKGVTYTIVRPSGLRDGDWKKKLRAKGPSALVVNQGDEVAGSISRADLAAICVECAFNDAAAKATFEVYDKGSELSTTSLTVSGILSNSKAQKVAQVIAFERPEDLAHVPTTGFEQQADTYVSLFSKLRPDDVNISNVR